MAQSKYWVFTLNNPTRTPVFEPEWMQYLVFEGEMGAETRTPHYQGYIQTKKNCRLNRLRKWLPGAHFEVSRGSHEEARDYCMKGDTDDSLCLETAQEFGEFVPTRGNQGQRTDLMRTMELIRVGAPRDDYIHDPTYVRNYRGLEHYRFLINDAIGHTDVRGEWWYGAPGTGKTRAAHAEYPDLYIKSQNKWWDGYNNESYVLLDDFDRLGTCLSHHLKIWGDRYPCHGEIKCGTVALRHTKIIITSNYRIDELFAGDNALILALERRYKYRIFHDDHGVDPLNPHFV